MSQSVLLRCLVQLQLCVIELLKKNYLSARDSAEFRITILPHSLPQGGATPARISQKYGRMLWLKWTDHLKRKKKDSAEHKRSALAYQWTPNSKHWLPRARHIIDPRRVFEERRDHVNRVLPFHFLSLLRCEDSQKPRSTRRTRRTSSSVNVSLIH